MSDNFAGKVWRGRTPRWDDGDVTPEAAAHAASAMRERVNGHESVLSGMDAPEAAERRKGYAPMYYDLHRAERLTSPDTFADRVTSHVATRGLAQEIARRALPTLSDALDHLSGEHPKADIAREYMLWRHSLHTGDDIADHPEVGRHLGLFGMKGQKPNVEGSVALDEVLDNTFGDHTRSPQAAKLGLLDRQGGPMPVKWFNSPEGDVATDYEPGAVTEAMSRSLVDRHFEPYLRRFNDWQRERGAPDLAPSSLAEGDHEGGAYPERGDYRAEFAHALAHGVFGDAPNPQSTACVRSHSVHAAGNAMNTTPRTHPSEFRAGVGGAEAD